MFAPTMTEGKRMMVDDSALPDSPRSDARPVEWAEEQAKRERELTDAVVASFAKAPNDRYRTIMQSLVRQIHSFARDVRLTDSEWQQAIDFLTRCGHITTDRRQEFILLSDVLGVSMLTVAINQPAEADATESTVFGPFFAEGAPEIAFGGDMAGGAKGQPCHVSGTVRGTSGDPVAGARIDVWEADDDGFYDVQYGIDNTSGRAWLKSDDQGRYSFWAVRPAPYPIPHDGPVGDLLTAAGRSPMRPAHIHFMVRAPGYHTLITHVFAAGDPYLGNDAVFGVKDTLVGDFSVQPPGDAPDGRHLDHPWARLEFNIVLASALR
jgi:hydroxyquinol 1,2-dioxygenase